MTGTPGLGSKPIKVNKVWIITCLLFESVIQSRIRYDLPFSYFLLQVSLQAKNKLMAQMEAQMAHKYENSMMQAAATAADPSATDYSQYWQSQYGQNWSQYAAWSQYYQQYYDPSQANAAYYGLVLSITIRVWHIWNFFYVDTS